MNHNRAASPVPVYTEFLALSGLPRAPLYTEVVEIEKFMALPVYGLSDLVCLARVFGPRDAAVRSTAGHNAYDGDHDAPDGGPEVLKEADKLVRLANRPNERVTPFLVHIRWMNLLPLTGGNLMAGLTLWCRMRRQIDGGYPASFLRAWYGEAIEAHRMKSS